MNITIKKSNIKIWSSEFVHISFAWVYMLEATTFYVKSNKLDNFIQIVFLSCMLIAIFIRGTSRRTLIDKSFMLYFILVCLTLIPDLINVRLEGIQISLTYLLPLILFVYITDYYHTKCVIDKNIFIIPLVYGFLISISGILVELLNFLGVLVVNQAVLIDKTDSIVTMESHGLGAVAYWGQLFGTKLVRIQGYYIEPSKMAAFLIIPIFVGWGFYAKYKSVICKWTSIVSVVCMVLTMSRAGYIALIGATVIARVIEKYQKNKNIVQERNHATLKDMRKLLYAGVVFVISAIIILRVMVFLGGIFPGLDFLFTGITDSNGNVNLIRSETVDIPYIWEIMLKSPIGYGFSNMPAGTADVNTNMANAFILWLISGGIAGAVVAVVIVMGGMMNYAIPAIKSNDPIKRAIAMCFIGLTIHSLSYGTWMTSDYLMIFALLIAQKGKVIV